MSISYNIEQRPNMSILKTLQTAVIPISAILPYISLENEEVLF